MHIAINPDGHVGVGIVSLRFESEVWCKVMTAINLCDAVKNIPVEDLEGFAIDCDLLSAELGAGRW